METVLLSGERINTVEKRKLQHLGVVYGGIGGMDRLRPDAVFTAV